MGKYSIKDIEVLTGVHAHTIRIWEQRYGIIVPNRTETNIRYYSDEQLKQVLNIAFLNQKGFKISKLALMNSNQINDEIEKLYESSESNNIYIHGLQTAMVDFDKNKFEKIFATCILKDGILKTMKEVIIPFMQKIGTMWITGIINPAQEHFITNMIRKKILVAIDGIVPEPNPNAKKFILYLPEGELHEIPLLIAYYVIKARHHDGLYMGASLPLNDLKKAINFIEPDYIVTAVTLPMADFSMDDYFDIVCSSFKNLNVWAMGSQTKFLNKLEKNLVKLEEVDKLIEQIQLIQN